jgi:23S rRNA (cytosine1962-C5)-methyltransferase
VRSGHPWIFANSIREQNRSGQTGELAIVFDRHNQFLAVGFYDESSPIRVRVLHAGSPAVIDGGWFGSRLTESLDRRAGILDEKTNAARLVNGESDRFPALVLDRYADTLVLKLYSSIWFPWLAHVIEIIQERIPCERLVLRLSRNIREAARERKLDDGQLLFGPAVEGSVMFSETGLRFEAEVIKGQKTGFFLDQRENRRFVESLARGQDVLNAFSFSGGFSLYAARGGARSVTDLDISSHALESSRRNFELNEIAVADCQHFLIQADAFAWLRQPRPERYDLIILDPPSLAKRQTDRPAALHAYASLAASALTLARPGATLLCCSCSSHITAGEFFGTVGAALEDSGRKYEILRQTGQPADHPATFPEAEYLKAIYVSFRRGSHPN